MTKGNPQGDSTTGSKGKIYSKANKEERDADSLIKQLIRQLNFLKKSALAYDQGDHEEAVRMAVSLRVLLHDTPKSHSLLSQIGLKDELDFVDTGLYRPRLDATRKEVLRAFDPRLTVVAIQPGEAGLVEMRANPDGRTAGYYAPLRDRLFHPSDPMAKAQILRQKFHEWWTTPLAETSTLKYFSRENLVLIMANQDGGAHVDAGIDIDYSAFLDDFLGSHMEFGVEHPGPTPDLKLLPPKVTNSVPFASVRQITYELQRTLQTCDLLRLASE